MSTPAISGPNIGSFLSIANLTNTPEIVTVTSPSKVVTPQIVSPQKTITTTTPQIISPQKPITPQIISPQKSTSVKAATPFSYLDSTDSWNGVSEEQLEKYTSEMSTPALFNDPNLLTIQRFKNLMEIIPKSNGYDPSGTKTVSQRLAGVIRHCSKYNKRRNDLIPYLSKDVLNILTPNIFSCFDNEQFAKLNPIVFSQIDLSGIKSSPSFDYMTKEQFDQLKQNPGYSNLSASARNKLELKFNPEKPLSEMPTSNRPPSEMPTSNRPVMTTSSPNETRITEQGPVTQPVRTTEQPPVISPVKTTEKKPDASKVTFEPTTLNIPYETEKPTTRQPLVSETPTQELFNPAYIAPALVPSVLQSKNLPKQATPMPPRGLTETPSATTTPAQTVPTPAPIQSTTPVATKTPVQTNTPAPVVSTESLKQYKSVDSSTAVDISGQKINIYCLLSYLGSDATHNFLSEYKDESCRRFVKDNKISINDLMVVTNDKSKNLNNLYELTNLNVALAKFTTTDTFKNADPFVKENIYKAGYDLADKSIKYFNSLNYDNVENPPKNVEALSKLSYLMVYYQGLLNNENVSLDDEKMRLQKLTEANKDNYAALIKSVNQKRTEELTKVSTEAQAIKQKTEQEKQLIDQMLKHEEANQNALNNLRKRIDALMNIQ